MKYKGIIKKKVNGGKIIYMVSFQHKNIRYEFGRYKTSKEAAKAYDLFILRKRIDKPTNFLKKVC